MTLYEFLKVFNGLDDIVIYHEDEGDTPIFEGSMFDVPFLWLDSIVMTRDETEKYDGAIISQDLDGTKNSNPKFNHRAGLVITVKH